LVVFFRPAIISLFPSLLCLCFFFLLGADRSLTEDENGPFFFCSVPPPYFVAPFSHHFFFFLLFFLLTFFSIRAEGWVFQRWIQAFSFFCKASRNPIYAGGLDRSPVNFFLAPSLSRERSVHTTFMLLPASEIPAVGDQSPFFQLKPPNGSACPLWSFSCFCFHFPSFEVFFFFLPKNGTAKGTCPASFFFFFFFCCGAFSS